MNNKSRIRFFSLVLIKRPLRIGVVEDCCLIETEQRLSKENPLCFQKIPYVFALYFKIFLNSLCIF